MDLCENIDLGNDNHAAFEEEQNHSLQGPNHEGNLDSLHL
jgi:hypothetical protein